MSKDIPLTVLDHQFNQMVKDTPSGMAYWAGTGPAGMTCRECCWFDNKGYTAGGSLKEGQCIEYTRLSMREGKAFPHDSKACKYFKLNASAPAPFKPREAK